MASSNNPVGKITKKTVGRSVFFGAQNTVHSFFGDFAHWECYEKTQERNLRWVDDKLFFFHWIKNNFVSKISSIFDLQTKKNRELITFSGQSDYIPLLGKSSWRI